MKSFLLPLPLILALLCLGPGRTDAQAPRFEGRTSLRKVITGETFELSFTLYNAPVGHFSPPDLGNWKVQSGPNLGQGSQTVYINGQMNRQQWTEYRYVLQAPDRPGRYSIGSAKMAAKGQTLTSKPLEIEVVNAASPNPKAKREQDISLGNEVLLVAEPLSGNTFAGEQVLIDFRLYFRVPLQEFDVIALPDIYNANVVEVERFDPSLQDRVLNGKEYTTQVLRRLAVYPLAEGPLEIGPLRIRVGVPVNDPWSIFFSQVMPYELESAPVRLNIKPPPPLPPGANGGGVGDFRVSASVSPSELSTDDALELTLLVEGKGDLRTIRAPGLRLPPDAFEVFEPVVEDGPSNDQEGAPSGWKRFVWTILPKTADPAARIPFDFTYLDTRSRTYRRLDTVFTVRVQPGNPKKSGASQLDYARQDIRPYHAEGTLETPGGLFFSSWAYRLLWTVPLGILLIALLVRLRPHEKPLLAAIGADLPASARTAPGQPRHPLLRKALAAKTAGDADGFYRALYEWTLNEPEQPAAAPLRQTCEMVLFAGVRPGDLEKTWEQVPHGL